MKIEGIWIPVGAEPSLIDLSSVEDLQALLGGPATIFGFGHLSKVEANERVVFWRRKDDAQLRPNRLASRFIPLTQDAMTAVVVEPENAVEIRGPILITRVEGDRYQPRPFVGPHRLYFMHVASSWPRCE